MTWGGNACFGSLLLYMDGLVSKKINLGNKNFILIMDMCLCLLGLGDVVYGSAVPEEARRGSLIQISGYRGCAGKTEDLSHSSPLSH